ncbi:MAG: VanZ family protein [bacterium]|nr:VanZ family protein [Candidatus Sumerlaeota bacterium]
MFLHPVRHIIFGQPENAIARWVPVAVVVIVIFILSSIPGDIYPRIDIPNADKGMHAILFLPLGWFFARAFAARAQKRAIVGREALTAMIAGIAYGALDEIHQIWTPRRECDVNDWLVDCAAVIIGVVLWQLYAWFALRTHAATAGKQNHAGAETGQT